MASEATRWRKARETRAILAEKFPACFTRQYSKTAKRPLKIGVLEDVVAACPDLNSYAIHLGINDFTNGPKYARCLVAGAVRIDLYGNPAGVVTEEEAELGAVRSLARRQTDNLLNKIRDLALFCVDVRGSGERIACPDYASALELSDKINLADPSLRAAPAPWGGSYDEHQLSMHCGRPGYEDVKAAA